MSSSVYESLPPDRHTITRSPCSIMRKSSMALPTSPRRRACSRRKLLEGSGRADMWGEEVTSDWGLGTGDWGLGAQAHSASDQCLVTIHLYSSRYLPSTYRSQAAADSGLPVALRISSGMLTVAASECTFWR